jgi:glycosyltransferase involved in cell wall biosynthesis
MAFNGGSMKKKVLLVGPLLTRSGYGEQARFALRSLRSREDLFEIFIRPITWGQTSWITDDNEERRWIDQTIEKTIGYVHQGGQFDISIQTTIPNEFQNLATKNIGYTAGIETTLPAPLWVSQCNSMDGVIVVSNHSKNILEAARFEGVDEATGEKVSLESTARFDAVNYPVKTFENLPDLNLQLETSFNFLTVAQFGPRKDLESTIKWFLQEFANDDVGLVVKTNVAKNSTMDRNLCFQNIKEMINQAALENKKCKIYLLHGNLSDEEMHALYVQENIHALVAIPHGEGFGLPLFEAAYSGLPVVSIGWSGQCDFLYDRQIPPKAHFYEVGFDIRPVSAEAVWEDVIVKEAGWAYAREGSFKEQLRKCYNDIQNNVEDSIALNACERAKQLSEDFSEETMYAQFVSCIHDENKEQEMDDEIEGLLQDLL